MMNYISIIRLIEEINKDFLNYIRNIFTMSDHSCCNTEHGLVVFSVYFFERAQNIPLLLRRTTILFCDKRIIFLNCVSIFKKMLLAQVFVRRAMEESR